MTPDQIVRRLIAAGFTFSLAGDGSASFVPPVTDTGEADELLGLLAWQWDELELAVLRHLATAKLPTFHPPPDRAQRAAG